MGISGNVAEVSISAELLSRDLVVLRLSHCDFMIVSLGSRENVTVQMVSRAALYISWAAENGWPSASRAFSIQSSTSEVKLS